MTTSYNDGSHDPVTGEYIKPEDRVQVSVGTSFDYNGTEYVSAGSTASYTVTTGAGGTAYDDPAYYASAVDFNVDTMVDGTTYPVPTATEDPRIDHVLEHLHNLETKIDHVLEHLHTPLSGFIHLNPPSKTGAAKTE